jgi:hypothetical protein
VAVAKDCVEIADAGVEIADAGVEIASPLKKALTKYNILIEDCYNMDETGFRIGTVRKQYIIAPPGYMLAMHYTHAVILSL